MTLYPKGGNCFLNLQTLENKSFYKKGSKFDTAYCKKEDLK